MESRPADDYKELLYVRRRFLSIEGLRQGIVQVVNATLDVRMPQVWGEARVPGYWFPAPGWLGPIWSHSHG